MAITSKNTLQLDGTRVNIKLTPFLERALPLARSTSASSLVIVTAKNRFSGKRLKS